jgi:L-2-hydroxyglutarate oxidase LhgO
VLREQALLNVQRSAQYSALLYLVLMAASVECVVIGAGVVGLAVARALARTRSVLVLESEAGIGKGTSSRNSEVLHAGIYYSANSLKARLCTEGSRLMYAYCDAAGVPYRKCGKLIVATSTQQNDSLRQLAVRAKANGVALQWLQASAVAHMEPAVAATAALWSPTTGIIDSHALMQALQGEAEAHGAEVCLHTSVANGSIQQHSGESLLRTADGTELQCKLVINCAGLSAGSIAASIAGLPAPPPLFYAKGNYFALAGDVSRPFTRLVYPAPEQAGLGVHATVDLSGQVRFGPDVQWLSGPPQDYTVDPARADAFYAKIRQYWPGLPDGALLPDYSGVRPKLQGM